VDKLTAIDMIELNICIFDPEMGISFEWLSISIVVIGDINRFGETYPETNHSTEVPEETVPLYQLKDTLKLDSQEDYFGLGGRFTNRMKVYATMLEESEDVRVQGCPFYRIS